MNTAYTYEGVNGYFKDIVNSAPLTRERERYLAARVREGDIAARDEMVTANLRFVVDVAKEYVRYGSPLMELISEGNSGLLEAVKRFDETRGFKFITYAVWWIRQSILKYLAEQNAVRVPNLITLDLRKVEKKISRLEQRLGRTISRGEACEQIELSEGRLSNALNVRREVSLDEPLRGYDDESPLYDLLEDTKLRPPDEELEISGQGENIGQLLEGLDEREEDIIKRYYGLGGYEPMTLDQIGSHYRLTRERIRQIRDQAQRKMRAEAIKRNISLSDILFEG